MSDDNSQTEGVTEVSQTEGVDGENAGEETKATGTETTDNSETEQSVTEESTENLSELQQKRDSQRKPHKEGTQTRREKFMDRRWQEAIRPDGSINMDTVLDLSEDPKLSSGLEIFAKKQGYKTADALVDAAERELLGPEIEKTPYYDPRVDKLLHEKEETDYHKWEDSILEETGGDNSVFDAAFKAKRDDLILKGHTLKEAGEIAFQKKMIGILQEKVANPKRKAGREALGLPEKSSGNIEGTLSDLIPRDEYMEMPENERVEYQKKHRVEGLVQFA